jgi:hypothetical protein
LALADRVLIFLRGQVAWEKPAREIDQPALRQIYFDLVAEAERQYGGSA